MNNSTTEISSDLAYSLSSESIPLPGSDSISKGYNVFDLYANPKSTTLELFNLGKQEQVRLLNKEYIKPKSVNVQEILEGNFYSYNEINISHYINKIKSTTSLDGNYNYFSGSLKYDFEKSEVEDKVNEFTKVTDLIQKYKLSIRDISLSTLIKMLKKEVRKDINQLSPYELFNKYGTHFLREIIVGAKCEFLSTTNQLKYHKKVDIKIAAELSYKKSIYKITAKEEKQYGEEIIEFNKTSTNILNVYGGKPEYGKYITKEGNYDKWIESIDESPIFCSFTENSLAPLWLLCNNEERQTELKNSFIKYATDYYSKPIPQKCVNNLKVIGSSNSGISPDFGYIKINKDLNEGAGGEYIYLCYKEGLDNNTNPDDPVTNIDVIVVGDGLKGARNKVPPKHILIEYDLNKGAGGKYIYFCYSKDTSYEPIRSIVIISGGSSDIPAPYGYTKIAKDLNAGAKGKYIYLCISKYL